MAACPTDVRSKVADPRLRRELTRALARRVDATEVEDLVQSTLAEALGAKQCPDSDEEIRRFVFSIARQRTIDWYRRRGRAAGLRIDAADATPSPESTLDLLQWVEHELPAAPDARQTFDWMVRESEGETLAQIAAEARLPAPAVRQRVSRLRRALRARWAKIGLALGGALLLLTQLREREVSPIDADRVPAEGAWSPPPALPPFDRAAAVRALGNVDLSPCKSAQGGSGRIEVKFDPSGAASARVISGPLAETPVGICVAAQFGGVRVAPFQGTTVLVTKSFSLE